MSRRALVLVIEDNPITRKLLRLALQAERHAVLEAATGAEALAHLQSAKPDLVLQDLRLPDIEGIDLVRQLRALPNGLDVPMIALSGDLAGLEQAQTAGAGFTAYLIKPVEPSRLIETIQRYLPEFRSAPEDIGKGRRLLVVDDDPVQLKLRELQLRAMGFRTESAHLGEAAVERATANPPDAIVSDVLMPGMDGFELCLTVRRNPQLAGVVVVLVTAHHFEPEDRELAARVGASALVERTPDPTTLGQMVADAIVAGAPPQPGESVGVLRGEHALRVVAQLERLAAENANLHRRSRLQGAELSLLRGTADAIGERDTVEATLSDVLAVCLDAAGISRGVLYLAESGGRMVPYHVIGFGAAQKDAVESFFGHPELLHKLAESEVAVSLPSPSVDQGEAKAVLDLAGVSSALVVPLAVGPNAIGALFMGSRDADSGPSDTLSLARSVGAQISQSVALTMAFARISASERNFRELIERAPDAILLRRGPRIVYVNTALVHCLGRDSPAEFIGQSLLDFTHAEDRPLLQATNLGSRPTEARMLRTDGEPLTLEFSAPVAIEFEGEPALLCIARDTTERKQIQSQLLASDRLASVGMLAAGVAHEINNPLAVVVANVELAADQVRELLRSGPTPALRLLGEELGDTSTAAIRVSQIVKDLKLFSRGTEEVREHVDVRSVLESTVRLAWNEIRHRATLVTHYDDLPPVLGNASRLGQVFLNLLVNAAQAIEEGKASRNEIRVTCCKVANDAIQVDIEDTGSGMTPEVQKRLFTPFFTTKPIGFGTGLGCPSATASSRSTRAPSRWTVNLDAARASTSCCQPPWVWTRRSQNNNRSQPSRQCTGACW